MSCRASPLGSDPRKVKIDYNFRFEDYREFFALTFGIETFMTSFRFYFRGKEIFKLADVESEDIKSEVIQLEVEYLGR